MVNKPLINAAAICIVLSTIYMAAEEVWSFVQYRQFQAQLEEDQLRAALLERLREMAK